VIDGHPAALPRLGSVRGHAAAPLGVNDFGQCSDSIALYITTRLARMPSYGRQSAAIKAFRV
tara:strand:+ start:136 stop:321 length:186 start_codon:yes stop_codon:yes gene_type:complete